MWWHEQVHIVKIAGWRVNTNEAKTKDFRSLRMSRHESGETRTLKVVNHVENIEWVCATRATSHELH